MSVSITLTLDTKELDRIAAQLGVKKAEVGKKIGPMVETTAKALVPTDTFDLKESILTTYPGGDVIARIQTNVPYGKYQELGFHHYKSGAFIQNPYFIPSIEQHTGVYFSPNTWKILFE